MMDVELAVLLAGESVVLTAVWSVTVKVCAMAVGKVED